MHRLAVRVDVRLEFVPYAYDTVVEQLEGSLNRFRVYWIEGGGTQERSPRWCILRNVLHWFE